MATGAGPPWPDAPSGATPLCPCMNAGEEIHAWKASSSRHRVITSQVVRSSVGLSSSKPSKPSWPSTAPARAANRLPSSSPLSAGTVMALILMTVIRSGSGLVDVAGDLVDEVGLHGVVELPAFA